MLCKGFVVMVVLGVMAATLVLYVKNRESLLSLILFFFYLRVRVDFAGMPFFNNKVLYLEIILSVFG